MIMPKVISKNVLNTKAFSSEGGGEGEFDTECKTKC